MSTYTSGDAAQVAGVSPSVLHSWIAAGAFTPSLAAPEGTGSTRRYSEADLVALRTMAILRSAGVHLNLLQPVVQRLQWLRLIERGADRVMEDVKAPLLVIPIKYDFAATGEPFDCSFDELTAKIESAECCIVINMKETRLCGLVRQQEETMGESAFGARRRGRKPRRAASPIKPTETPQRLT